jgi:CheY-like chemotaxis protein
MNNNELELLLIEDDPNDVELTLLALRKHKLANKIHVVRDGEEALDFVFSRVNSYIQKPIDFGQFQTIIRDLGYYWRVVNQSPPPEAFPAQ